MIHYPNLFTPITIRGVTFKNRIVAAPEGGAVIFDGALLPRHVYRNNLLGQYGVGEIILGDTSISRRFSRSSDQVLDYKDPEIFRLSKQYPDMIKKYGAVATVELAACGEMSGYGGDSRVPVKGPMEYDREDGVHIYAMTEADIHDLCEDFAAAALNMKKLGFDGVVIHAGHGWLFSQFLDPQTNRRTDRFGGSAENRARIAVMVMERVRMACGENFLIECRISGSMNIPGSYTLEDICTFCQLIDPYVDIIHVSAGQYRDPGRTKMLSTTYDEHGCNVSIAAEIKKRVRAAVAVVGGINDPDFAEMLLATGKADFICFGRAFRSDPAFVEKLRMGRSAEIRKCIRCMACFAGPKEECIEELGEDGVRAYTSRCSINPYYPYSGLEQTEQAAVRKRVLVVGGGVAGMQAAITAADRGHSVTLVEKEPVCGGVLCHAEYDPHKRDLLELVRTMKAEMQQRAVEVRVSTEVSQSLVDELRPEVVVSAIGAHAVQPAVPGGTGKNVILAENAEDPAARIGVRVVVLGGGITGCETAIALADRDCKVVLVQRGATLAADAYRLHRQRVLSELEGRVECHCNTACSEIRPDGVVLRTADGRETVLSADTVVWATGRRANGSEAIRQMVPGAEFYEIGDCVAPRKIKDALAEGYQIALVL